MAMHNQLSVFVKPWKELPLAKLGRHIRGLGFEAIELPVRPGFPCQPTTIEQDLPVAVHTLADEGVEVLSITADNKLDDERMYAACAASGVSL